jgi:hypothetical protein
MHKMEAHVLVIRTKTGVVNKARLSVALFVVHSRVQRQALAVDCDRKQGEKRSEKNDISAAEKDAQAGDSGRLGVRCIACEMLLACRGGATERVLLLLLTLYMSWNAMECNGMRCRG